MVSGAWLLFHCKETNSDTKEKLIFNKLKNKFESAYCEIYYVHFTIGNIPYNADYSFC